MARNLSPTTDRINLGDIIAARFERFVVWTFITFFRVEDTATDDRCICSKFGSAADNRQFLLRTDLQAAPGNLEVYTANNLRISGSDNIQLNTWYLVAVISDGTGAFDGLRLLTLELDGTIVDDLTGDPLSESAVLTADLILGRTAGGSDPMDGDLANAAYFDREFGLQDVLAYLKNPSRVAAQYAKQFYLPLEGVDSLEPDYSGNKNNGILTGTSRSNNPPVIPYSARFWGHGPLVGIVAADDNIAVKIPQQAVMEVF